MSLHSEIESIINASGAEMGVAVHHLETDEHIHINADTSFPMCSVLKIPVLCEAFRQMNAGKFSLDDRWDVTLDVKNVGSGILTYLQDGLTPTVRDLLTLMIVISDNTATDMIMQRTGVEHINAFMHQLGLTDIHMASTIRGIFDAMYEDEDGSDPRRLFTALDRKKEALPIRREGQAFSSGPDNNVSTPRDMTRLLAMIFRGQVVDRTACNAMLTILLQQQLNARLPALLPYGVPFAHKTGTLPGIRNDAGIVYASDSDHIAVTVFSRWDAAAVEDDPVAAWEKMHTLDRTFGQIGHLLYDTYCDNSHNVA